MEGTTAAELLHALDARGHDVGARQITDWVQKGLMPPRTARGRGRGRGKLYTWSQPDIVERAAMIDILLGDYARTGHISLALWLLGFDMPLGQIRPLLYDYVASLHRGITGASGDPDDMADAISRMAVRATRQRGNRFEDWVTPEIVEAWIGTLVLPGYRMSRPARRDLAAGLRAPLPHDRAASTPEAVRRLEALADELSWLGELLPHCALLVVSDAVRGADDAALRRAHHQWRITLPRLRSLLGILIPDADQIPGAYGRNGAVKLGALFVALYLRGLGLGLGERMDGSLERGLAWVDGTAIPWACDNRALLMGRVDGTPT